MYSHNAQMKCGANYATLPRIMARPARRDQSRDSSETTAAVNACNSS